MRVAMEIIIAFLAAGGLLALGWFLFGGLLTPVAGGEIFAVVPARGVGGRLEHDLACLRWLRTGGLARPTIVILDEGLDSEGLRVVALLLEKEPELRFCPAGQLEHCLKTP